MRLMLVIGSLLAVAASAAAQTFAHYPDNNLSSGGCNTYPFRSTGASWRYQMLVPASSLPAQPVQITDIAFAACSTSPPLFDAPQFQIRMAHTTMTTLSSIFANNFSTTPVPVFDSPIRWQPTYLQWTDLGLQQSFPHDGLNNLVIEVRYRGRVAPSGSMRSNPTGSRVWNNSAADPYAATSGTASGTYALKVRLTYQSTVLSISGSPSPGGTIDLDLLSPSDPGALYQIASSLGTGPIPVGSRTLNLSPDDLLVVTVFGYLPSVFVNYSGGLSAGGRARGNIRLLNNPALTGVRIHTAFVILDPSAPQGIRSISNTASFTIQ